MTQPHQTQQPQPYSAQPNPQMQGQGYGAPARKTSGAAITSLVLGILWIGGLGAVLAVIFGVVGMKATRDGHTGGHGLAVAGLVLGIIGVVGAIFMWAVLASASNAINDCVNAGTC